MQREFYEEREASIIVVSSCTAKKDDSIPIASGSRIVSPKYYLTDNILLEKLIETRDRVFQDLQAEVGSRITYAYDLYVRGGIDAAV